MGRVGKGAEIRKLSKAPALPEEECAFELCVVAGESMHRWRKGRRCLQGGTITSLPVVFAQMARLRMSAVLTGEPFKR